MQGTVLKENKMGVMPMNKLLLGMALPMVASMIVQALYNVVDSIFVSMLGQDELNAVSMAFPIQNIIISVASGLGVGVNALISRSLGEGKREAANRYASLGVFLSAVSYILMLIFGFVGCEAFFRSQTGVEAIIEGGTKYLSICCIFSFGAFGQIIFEKLMQSTGKTSLSMYTQGFGAIINIILDPIFIFGWLGMPAMGVAGAAVATVVGQIASMLLGIYLNHRLNKEITVSFLGFKVEWEKVKRILVIGFPAIIMMAIGSVMTYSMNLLLGALEPTGVATAVFGVYFKLQSFVILPVVGMTHGMMPIVSYNLGAEKKSRMLSAYRYCTYYSFGYLCLCSALMFAIPGVLIGFFSPTPAMLALGKPALRIIAVGYLFTAYSLVNSSFFQALGRSVLSMVMSIARQLGFLVPLAIFFALVFGLEAVWWAIPMAEFGVLVVAIFGRIRINKRVINQIPDSENVNNLVQIEA